MLSERTLPHCKLDLDQSVQFASSQLINSKVLIHRCKPPSLPVACVNAVAV